MQIGRCMVRTADSEYVQLVAVMQCNVGRLKAGGNGGRIKSQLSFVQPSSTEGANHTLF